MHSIEKIYVDMDGVIADFEKRYSSLYGYISDTQRRKEFVGNFKDFIATEQFATLELMPDALVLIAALNNIDIPKEILSSTAHQENYSAISAQKHTWLDKHSITWSRNFVPGKQHKYKWATPNSIIIDDTLSVIQDWEKAGGITIHHKNAETTLAELDFILQYA